MIQPYYSKAAYYGSFFREKDGDINHLGLDAKLNGTAKYQKVNLVDQSILSSHFVGKYLR